MSNRGVTEIEYATPYEIEMAIIYDKYEKARPDLVEKLKEDTNLFFTKNDKEALGRVYEWRKKAKELFLPHTNV